MFKIVIGNSHRHKYVKCSDCKLIDSISPLYSNPTCPSCHKPLREISEAEYKLKIAEIKRRKEEKKKKIENNNNINNNYNNNQNRNYHNIDNNHEEGENYNNRHRNNSSLHSSKIQFNEDNNIDININNNNININANNNININNNNININNNNNNHNNNDHHHGHHRVQMVRIIRGGNHGNQNIIRIRRDNSSDRDDNAGHRINRMIIIGPSHHRSNNNNMNINVNMNSNNNNNQNNHNININNNQNMQIISNNNHHNPFRIIVQRQHVPNHIFDPNFTLFGSTFDHVFQENFSSNFRSNFRGNFVNEILNAISFNRAELRRSKKQHPISQENANKLKKFNLTKEYCKKDEKGNLEKPNCCICLDEIELGKETLLLPCGHMFHSNCGFTWLKKSNTCPICRFEIK